MKNRPVISPVTSFILLLLREKPHTSIELAERIGVFPSRLQCYLRHLSKKGLITRNSFSYTLTSDGEAFVEKYYDHLMLILNTKYGINLNEHKLIQMDTNEHKLNNIKNRILSLIKKELNEELWDCFPIVEFLLEYRLKTGKLYWISPEHSLEWALKEEINCCSSSVILDCLKQLRAKAIIYITIDSQTRTPKIRLDSRFDSLFKD